ncbi:hypothetical protein D3C87_1378060 [compost metagenome]
MRLVEIVLVVLGYQVTEGQRHGRHVLDAVIAISGIGQRADLGNNPDRRLMRGDDDFVDFMQAITHLRVQRHRRLTRRLCVKLGRKTDLEQHVFHHITAVRPREAELTFIFRLERQIVVGMAEQYVVKTPLIGTQNTGNSHLAAHCNIRQSHTTTRRIACRPRLARAGIRRMPIGA